MYDTMNRHHFRAESLLPVNLVILKLLPTRLIYEILKPKHVRKTSRKKKKGEEEHSTVLCS